MRSDSSEQFLHLVEPQLVPVAMVISDPLQSQRRTDCLGSDCSGFTTPWIRTPGRFHRPLDRHNAQPGRGALHAWGKRPLRRRDCQCTTTDSSCSVQPCLACPFFLAFCVCSTFFIYITAPCLHRFLCHFISTGNWAIPLVFLNCHR